MKLKTIIFVLVALLCTQSCTKEDFEALRHPLVFEGDLDPVFGIPVAKKTITATEITGLIHPKNGMKVFIGPEGLVSVSYYDTLRSVYDYSDCKRLQSFEDGDSLYLPHIIFGTITIPFFDLFRNADSENLKAKEMFISAKTLIQSAMNDSIEATFNHGVRIHLDSVTFKVDCSDGFNPSIPVLDNGPVINEAELYNGYNVTLLDNYDLSPIVSHQPKRIHYIVHMTTTIPLGDWYEGSAEPYIRSIGIDSVISTTFFASSFPLQLYCNNIEYADTAEWKPSESMPNDSIMKEIERYLTLDSTSCLILESRNYIPISPYADITLLDSNMNILYEHLLGSNNKIAGAPIKPIDNFASYISNGYTESSITIPIDWELFKNLKNTHYIKYSLKFSTSTLGTHEKYPTVAIDKDDRIELQARIVLAPHVHFATNPIDIK